MFALRNASTLIRSVAGNSIRSKVTLPKLPYDYNALEPIICREIMELHHQNHHRTSINNLNRIEEQLHLAIIRQDTTNIVALNAAFKFNAGSHINHSIFWQNLSPSYSKPSSELNLVIKQQFGSLDNVQKELVALAVSLRGSGWAWLGYNKNTGKLQLATCANQDPLEATTGLTPLFGIDVWEHAYYLQYKSMKHVYARSIFEIANWDDISERFAKIHHQKHHKSYVENLASAQKEIHWAIVQGQYSKIVSLNNTIAFNAGAHTNHSIFWENLTPKKCVQSKELRIAIRKNFGCFYNLKKRTAGLASSIYGSGWVWLGYNKNLKILQLAVTANQDPLEAITGKKHSFRIIIHHQKHHQAYVTNLNAAEEQLQAAVAKNDISKIIALNGALKFNGGGHINHTIFWQNLSPCKSEPSNELKQQIEEDFSSFDNFKKELTAATVAVQGSGWGWLGFNKKTCKLQIATCANQDPLEATTGLIPLFGIDVWEHAYYLQYKNVRPSYVEAIYEIANWDDISARFAKATK